MDRKSAVELATDSLRTYIFSGEVKPGARLKEIQLADQLGVARATLRASLARLKTEGIVIQIPYAGWEVMKLHPNDVWELWTLRGSLESLASKIAAERMNPEIEAAVEGALDNLVSACGSGSLRDASEADFMLHRTIVESIEHHRLLQQYLQVEQQIRFYILSSNELVGDDLSSIVSQHDQMLEALFSRDSTRAAEEAWKHNASEGGKLMAAVRRQRRTPSET